jgi:hypothetical protein
MCRWVAWVSFLLRSGRANRDLDGGRANGAGPPAPAGLKRSGRQQSGCCGSRAGYVQTPIHEVALGTRRPGNEPDNLPVIGIFQGSNHAFTGKLDAMDEQGQGSAFPIGESGLGSTIQPIEEHNGRRRWHGRLEFRTGE